MIEFFYELDFGLDKEEYYIHWLNRVLVSEGFVLGDLNYIFCDDTYLLEINKKYLYHDTFTDIITFDYSESNVLNGDIFISIERVRENAGKFKKDFDNELLRVMSHGILHLMDYNDKTQEDVLMMREKEEEKIKMFHVEQL
ncbi:rRNA maturation RNase YbeY [Maribacter luteus]|uniref:rRNA maturation RNase YbeY n=1 Tax=Maribacter luteus TaxID=2594478 RepID=UPI00248F53E9|nr:rRNA maturation RNase YbeY [Maribacter luteus]